LLTTRVPAPRLHVLGHDQQRLALLAVFSSTGRRSSWRDLLLEDQDAGVLEHASMRSASVTSRATGSRGRTASLDHLEGVSRPCLLDRDHAVLATFSIACG